MEKFLIKSLNKADRPRERLLQQGAATLSPVELLAILIGTGSKSHSVLEVAQNLLSKSGGLQSLARFANGRQLSEITGLGPAKTAIILAALELGKRIAQAESLVQEQVSSAEAAAAYLMPRLRYENCECFMVLCLSSKNKVVGAHRISVGSLNAAIVHPREVFGIALEYRSAAIIVGHNHPSGDPQPSREDSELTASLVQAGKLLGIPVLDHVIIGDGRYYSFKDYGLV